MAGRPPASMRRRATPFWACVDCSQPLCSSSGSRVDGRCLSNSPPAPCRYTSSSVTQLAALISCRTGRDAGLGRARICWPLVMHGLIKTNVPSKRQSVRYTAESQRWVSLCFRQLSVIPNLYRNMSQSAKDWEYNNRVNTVAVSGVWTFCSRDLYEATWSPEAQILSHSSPDSH